MVEIPLSLFVADCEGIVADAVRARRPVTITRAGRPIARLVPVTSAGDDTGRADRVVPESGTPAADENDDRLAFSDLDDPTATLDEWDALNAAIDRDGAENADGPHEN